MREIHRIFLYLLLAFSLSVANAAPRDFDRVAALHSASSGQVQLATDASTGKARFVRTTGDLLPAARGLNKHQKAMAFLAAHGQVMGIDNADQLRQLRNRVDRLGHTTLSYEQTVNQVPVFGARINASFRPDDSLYSITGDFAEGLVIDTQPGIPARRASRIALDRVAAMKPAASLSAQTPELYVYRQSLRANADGPAVLAWHVEVGNGKDIREFVFVNATNGKIVDQYTGIHEALNRRVYDGGFNPAFLVWSEGQATPFGNAAIDNLIDFSADSYHFFANLTDGQFLSWDGNDGIMHAVNNEPTITCPNARWNGVSIDFCNGTSSDDVVTHEWAHAYTESTHGLIYRWQSGALNESYSDIFGEIVDQINTDGTDAPGALRTPGSCTNFGGSTPPTLDVLSPGSVAGGYSASGATFNPSSANVTGDLVLVNDGVNTGSDGCQAIVNSLADSIALIDRGSCDFVVKVQNAQAAGAIGVVIANNAAGAPINMGGSPAGINIPSVMVTQADGQTLRSVANVTAQISLGGTGENSLRWLMGEDAFAFGGAIRDMWSPTCFGDPGKVSDTQYFCSSADGGGVHSNSGVPNHAFALLVDGGNYNGVTVNAIGITRAAHIYWRAANNYQVPTTDFVDHADALELACADLINTSVPNLSTEASGAAGSVTISQADCDAVAAAIAAVELRVLPIQCDFQPLLAQDAPALCETGSNAQAILSEDFEGGLNGWTPGTRAIANPATFSGPDWSVSGNLPDNRAGSAAYGPNLVLGNCATDIEAGIVFLQSPVIAVPSGINTPRVAFDHNVQTEGEYDGGNLKVSVNGGAFQIVPASAYTFNPYNSNLVSSDNPMSGEGAFNGSDGGSLSSIWGQSQISLAGIASPGDTVQFRFELGMDGCNGLNGWYVDDVEVYSCEVGQVDSDGDSVPDSIDNCTEIANADQRDTNGDGIGNICDADLDNNNIVNFADLQIVQSAFFANPASPNWNPDSDLNGDNVTNFLDLLIVQAQFFGPPGPSAD